MVEKLLEDSEELLIDTPYLRRIRQLGREEGLEKGVEIGREQGVEIGLRTAILEGVVRKFNPPLTDYRLLEEGVARLHQPEKLQTVLLSLLEVTDITAVLDLITELDKD